MRVTVYGDSILSSCQDYLAWDLGVAGHEFKNQTYPGSAPCDWFHAADANSGWTDLAVVAFMGNTFTACTQNRVGTVEQIYAEDIEHFGAIFSFVGTPVLWVSAPGITNTYEASNWRTQYARATAAKYTTNQQRFTDAADVLRRPDGFYQSWLPCDAWDRATGHCMFDAVAGIRSDDMVHLQASGQRRYADRIAAAI